MHMLYIHSLDIYKHSCNILAMIQVLGGKLCAKPRVLNLAGHFSLPMFQRIQVVVSFTIQMEMSQHLGQPKTSKKKWIPT